MRSKTGMRNTLFMKDMLLSSLSLLSARYLKEVVEEEEESALLEDLGQRYTI